MRLALRTGRDQDQRNAAAVRWTRTDNSVRRPRCPWLGPAGGREIRNVTPSTLLSMNSATSSIRAVVLVSLKRRHSAAYDALPGATSAV